MILEAWNLRRRIVTHDDRLQSQRACLSIALTHLAYRVPIPHRVNESFVAKGTIVQLFKPRIIQLSTIRDTFH